MIAPLMAPAMQTLTQISRNLAQTAIAQQIKDPYVLAALTPFVEFVIENVMQTVSPQTPTETLPETKDTQCQTTAQKPLDEAELLKFIQQYNQYQTTQP